MVPLVPVFFTSEFFVGEICIILRGAFSKGAWIKLWRILYKTWHYQCVNGVSLPGLHANLGRL